RDIQTDRANLFHGWFPSCGSNDTAFWHIAMPVGGAIHSIKSGPRKNSSTASKTEDAGPFR
ncbi:MAG: hypothetical protein ACR2RE_29110, partial [Geminicoccaceae bacterium]